MSYTKIQNLANRTTWDDTTYYQGHREQTMLSIRQAVHVRKTAKKIIVIGVGNANDLDLPELASLAGDVWLADIDQDSIARALARWGFPEGHKSNFAVWIGDAGGSSKQINDFLRAVSTPALGSISRTALSEALNRLAFSGTGEDHGGGLPYSDEASFPDVSFDIVVSQCVLSQILWPITEAFWDKAGVPWEEGQRTLACGSQDPLFEQLAVVLRRLALGHLEWLARRLGPGGTLIVNTDTTWRGVSLYGTDVARLIALPGQSSLSNSLELEEQKDWEWQLDPTTTAIVRSFRLQKNP